MNAGATAVKPPQTSTAADVRPYIVRTYDRWIILVLVLVCGWFLFRPLFAFSVYYRGVSYERFLELDTAEHYYAKSTRVYARIPEGWQAWGELYMMKQRTSSANYHKAVDILSKGLENNPTSAPIAFDLGRTYFTAGEYTKARLSFERSARYAPADLFSWDLAAWASYRTGNRALAMKYWRQVLKIDPRNQTAHRMLAGG